MHLWKGELTYCGQCFTLHTQTNGYKDPLDNFCHQIAKKKFPGYDSKDLKGEVRSIKNYFMDGKDRYRVMKVNRKKKGGNGNG